MRRSNNLSVGSVGNKVEVCYEVIEACTVVRGDIQSGSNSRIEDERLSAVKFSTCRLTFCQCLRTKEQEEKKQEGEESNRRIVSFREYVFLHRKQGLLGL